MEPRLLKGYRAGDTAVLGELYRAWRVRVEDFLACGFSFQSQGEAKRFPGLSPGPELDDAVAETFRRALGPSARRNYDPAHSFEGYLLTIARNQVLELRRRTGRRRRRDGAWAQQEQSGTSSVSGVMNPEDEALLAEVRQKLTEGLGSLEVEQRALAQWLLEGRSQRDIAQGLGLRRSEVRRMIHQLRRSLGGSLKRRGVSPNEALSWLEARSGLSRSVGWTTGWRSSALSGVESSQVGVSLALPARFGSYLLLEKIGAGGMAEVFKAKKLGLEGFERFVAVKLMRPAVARRPDLVSMFIDEAKIAAQLDHRNIARILELGRHHGVYFIAMEYIEGRDLAWIWSAMRARRLSPDIDLACYVASEVAEALDVAHHGVRSAGRALGVVHRDISPRNILISHNGEVKVIDFGLAKAAMESSSTQDRRRKGTLRTMSPEQLRGEEVDGRSDLFSLGVVLYELLTLERLFDSRVDLETLAQRRADEVLPPSVLNPGIPRDLESLVLRSLAPAREGRFQSAAAMADALTRFMRHRDGRYGAKRLTRTLQALG